MEGKVKETDMDSIVLENLEMMDNLLENRKVNVSKTEALKSEGALIAYINQSNYGKWIINRYAHLSTEDRLTFIKGINKTSSLLQKSNSPELICFSCSSND